MSAKQLSLPLRPSTMDASTLRETLKAYTEACLYAADVGRRSNTTGNARIHHLCYRTLRTTYGLSANLAIRAIAQAARALKKGRLPSPPPYTIEYDPRIFSIDWSSHTVSLSTIQGRLRPLAFQAQTAQSACYAAATPRRAVLEYVPPDTFILHVEFQEADAS